MRVLVTGFSSWEGSKGPNPSELVAQALKDRAIQGAEIHSIVLDLVFDSVIEEVMQVVRKNKPDLILMLGEYPGRCMITVERLAQNYVDATRYNLKDSAGAMPQGVIRKGGPPALCATVPLRAMVLEMRKMGVPADISDAAGTFGCNFLFFGVLDALQVENSLEKPRAGWIHLPSLPETAALDENLGMPSMGLDLQMKGVEAAIRAVISHVDGDTDAPVKYGSTTSLGSKQHFCADIKPT